MAAMLSARQQPELFDANHQFSDSDEFDDTASLDRLIDSGADDDLNSDDDDLSISDTDDDSGAPFGHHQQEEKESTETVVPAASPLHNASKSSLLAILAAKQEDLRLAAEIGEALFEKNESLESHVKDMEKRIAELEGHRVHSHTNTSNGYLGIDSAGHPRHGKHARVSTASTQSFTSTLTMEGESPQELVNSDSDDSIIASRSSTDSSYTRLNEELSRAQSALKRAAHRHTMSEHYHTDIIRDLKKQRRQLIHRCKANEQQCKSIIAQMTAQIAEQQRIIAEQSESVQDFHQSLQKQLQREKEENRKLREAHCEEMQTERAESERKLHSAFKELDTVHSQWCEEQRLRKELEQQFCLLQIKIQQLQFIINKEHASHVANTQSGQRRPAAIDAASVQSTNNDSTQTDTGTGTQTPHDWFAVCASGVNSQSNSDQSTRQQSPLIAALSQPIFSGLVSPVMAAVSVSGETIAMESMDLRFSLSDTSVVVADETESLAETVIDARIVSVDATSCASQTETEPSQSASAEVTITSIGSANYHPTKASQLLNLSATPYLRQMLQHTRISVGNAGTESAVSSVFAPVVVSQSTTPTTPARPSASKFAVVSSPLTAAAFSRFLSPLKTTPAKSLSFT